MSQKKKFGTFAGVFTPSVLTILGVIMYMRLGWVVGNAGLIGAIVIIVIAHVIAVTTGLSVSSVATDKKIGAGGIYYVLSRSMGIPIGGSIGIALFVGTAFSIALYLIGFAESFNAYLGLGTTINDLRLTGTIALFALTVLALISTSVALKTQFIILAAIVISLISIFFGSTEFAPTTVNLFSDENAIPLEVVFAVFFPAVTGFTAGIAMSGDLEDSKRSIPRGTLFAIGVGLIVYIVLAVFMAYTIDSETLKTDYNILMKIALFAPAVVAGIWGATLSSALGGILGGPRILQAMSIDKVTPSIFFSPLLTTFSQTLFQTSLDCNFTSLRCNPKYIALITAKAAIIAIISNLNITAKQAINPIKPIHRFTLNFGRKSGLAQLSRKNEIFINP